MRFLKKHWGSLLLLTATLITMVWIAAFSAQPAADSSAASRGICFFLASLWVRGFSGLPQADQLAEIRLMEPIVRKVAHFCIFAALGFFCYLTVQRFIKEQCKAPRRVVSEAGCLLFCLLYAASDELHQRFVPGRYGCFRDVCIDFAGALLGLAVAMLLLWLFRVCPRKRQKSTKNTPGNSPFTPKKGQ